MKALLTALLLSGFATSAMAYTDVRTVYYCTVGNPFTNGISNKTSVRVLTDDSVSGVLNGKAFSFKAKGSFNRSSGIATYKDQSTGTKVEIQVPGPYDGLQDTMWGKITIQSESKAVNCYLGDS